MPIFGFLLVLLAASPVALFAAILIEVGFTTGNPIVSLVTLIVGLKFAECAIVPVIASTPWVRYLK